MRPWKLFRRRRIGTPDSRHTSRRNRQRTTRIEGLEARCVLSANAITFDTDTGIARIQGTTDNDDAIVTALADGRIRIRLIVGENTEEVVFDPGILLGVRFDADAGDDHFFNNSAATSLVFGGDGNDHFEATTGPVEFHGEGDDDLLIGSMANDVLNGGDGDDDLRGRDGDDLLIGGSDDDVLLGSNGNDRLEGGRGEDRLSGNGGDDELFGGPDADNLRGGTENDQLFGEEGDDTLDGDAGDDTVSGGEGDDEVRGGKDDDILFGDAGNDLLFGEKGNDTAYGGPGNDTLQGNEGSDILFGGEDDDLLKGSRGDDQLFGDAGNDQLLGGFGDDQLFGGDGSDLLQGNSGNDALVGGGGTDDLQGGSQNDLLIGGADADSLVGSGGADILIGAITDYDTDPDAIAAIVSLWSSESTYHDRIAALEDDHFAAQLQSTQTVHDDGVRDQISGRGDLDWFFLTGEMPNSVDGGHTHGSDDGHHDPPPAAPPLESTSAVPPDLADIPTIAELRASLDKITDLKDGEAVNSRIAHATNATLRAEHFALLELTEYRDVSHATIATGNWSDPNTWHDGMVPGDGANVLISAGTAVTIDGEIATRVRTIRIDGTLRFDTTQDTHLIVDTIVGSGSATFEMGTAENPIPVGVTARLTFSGEGPIDREWDPTAVSRGLINHGRTSIIGAETTGFAELASHPRAGDSVLQLAVVPVNWQVGDQIVVPATQAGVEEDELREILAIDGASVTIAPLAFDHVAPRAELAVHVAHLSRNAILASESTAFDQRGHVMFMHTRQVDVRYAGFYDLGRTDKLNRINDSKLNAEGELVNGTGTNQRARYSVHFHRNGVVADSPPATVIGSVATNSPGWGFVNHSSYVNFERNVAYNNTGAGFVTEVGDEIGAMRDNIAIRSRGSGETTNNRADISDFGHQGDGFWLQGTGVAVENNIAIDHSGNGIVIFPRDVDEAGLGIGEFLSENLPDPSIADGAEKIGVDETPLVNMRDNTAYASDNGIRFHGVQQAATHNAWGEAEGMLIWNSRVPLVVRYTRQTVFRDVTIVGNLDNPVGSATKTNAVTENIVYENLSIEGYNEGLHMPLRGDQNQVIGGYFNNVLNIIVDTPIQDDYQVRLTGDIEFGTLTSAALRGREPANVVMRATLEPRNGGVEHLFFRSVVLLDFGPFENRQLYFLEQARDFIPFPVAGSDIPEQYVGLSNQVLAASFGVAIGGELPPAIIDQLDGIIGLIGPVSFPL